MLRWILPVLLVVMLLLFWRLAKGRSGATTGSRARPGLSPVQELQGAPPSFGSSPGGERGDATRPAPERAEEGRQSEADSDAEGSLSRSTRRAER